MPTEEIQLPSTPHLDAALARIADEPEDAAARELEAERAATVAAALEACEERFPKRYAAAETDRDDVLAWVAAFHASPAEAPSLLLQGPTGTGKTYQAYAAIREAVSIAIPTRAGGFRSPTWRAMTYAELTASLRPRGRDYDTETILDGYRKLGLLLIDDLGAGKLTEFTEEATYRLINGRYEDMRPSIFTSNLGIAEFRDAVGDRIASRLAEICQRVVLTGPDRRRGK
jgi:DNA replication protein DnaC